MFKEKIVKRYVRKRMGLGIFKRINLKDKKKEEKVNSNYNSNKNEKQKENNNFNSTDS